jgi:hypothetical protein
MGTPTRIATPRQSDRRVGRAHGETHRDHARYPLPQNHRNHPAREVGDFDDSVRAVCCMVPVGFAVGSTHPTRPKGACAHCQPGRTPFLAPPEGLFTATLPMQAAYQTTPGAPIKQKKAARRPPFSFRQIARSSSMSRIWPMARVGFSPFGHTLTQFMMPRQRNSENGSSRRLSRSSRAVSRLSARKR